jgi:hypothetical protein
MAMSPSAESLSPARTTNDARTFPLFQMQSQHWIDPSMNGPAFLLIPVWNLNPWTGYSMEYSMEDFDYDDLPELIDDPLSPSDSFLSCNQTIQEWTLEDED